MEDILASDDQIDGPETVEKNNTCKYCLKKLSSGQSLREHLYIHTGEKPYLCNEPGCNKAFRYGSLLSIHKRIHKEVKQGISAAKKKEKKEIALKLTDIVQPNLEIHRPLSPQKAVEIRKNISEFEFIRNFLSS